MPFNTGSTCIDEVSGKITLHIMLCVTEALLYSIKASDILTFTITHLIINCYVPKHRYLPFKVTQAVKINILPRPQKENSPGMKLHKQKRKKEKEKW